jgi:hypothetical protein
VAVSVGGAMGAERPAATAGWRWLAFGGCPITAGAGGGGASPACAGSGGAGGAAGSRAAAGAGSLGGAAGCEPAPPAGYGYRLSNT